MLSVVVVRLLIVLVHDLSVSGWCAAKLFVEERQCQAIAPDGRCYSDPTRKTADGEQ